MSGPKFKTLVLTTYFGLLHLSSSAVICIRQICRLSSDLLVRQALKSGFIILKSSDKLIKLASDRGFDMYGPSPPPPPPSSH